MMDTSWENSSKPAADSTISDRERERKQRNREYRVAARREKRNRKADEKKQRKLNATILRRMTRNPDKYNKNAERNRLRDIEVERRKIWQEAVRQAQRLAAIHDPSGAQFNVAPVVTMEDGSVITQDALRRREEKRIEKAIESKTEQEEGGQSQQEEPAQPDAPAPPSATLGQVATHDSCAINPDRQAQIDGGGSSQHRSKSQLKKLAKFEPRPPPPRPIIPEHIAPFEGEENWLSLWDLADADLERRVIRDKRRRAAERKALRVRQQSGKVERRMARDEKRKVYRDLKEEWKTIKEETTREKARLKAIEDEESRKIAVEISETERRRALACCAALGFTLENTEGIESIKPKAMGMKGHEVDFEAFEKLNNYRNDIEPNLTSRRVDLSAIPQDGKAEFVPSGQSDGKGNAEEFIRLDTGEGQDFEKLNYNHKVRRKLRRAIEHAEIEKELLVRQHTVQACQDRGLEVPAILQTDSRPNNSKGQRILENGTIESAKQERVRARMELADFNARMRVLRRQAKETAVYAGLRKHAELTGRIAIEEAFAGNDQVQETPLDQLSSALDQKLVEESSASPDESSDNAP